MKSNTLKFMMVVVVAMMHLRFFSLVKVCDELSEERTDKLADDQNEKLIWYGHVHMAKTAGTSLNGMMAAQYERVCGHKGYSQDFFKINGKSIHTKGDSYNVASNNKGSRSRVPQYIMDEVGYEDCDWISFEYDANAWRKFADWPYGEFEIHVPCRDPLDHLMSFCNFKHETFNCSLDDDAWKSSIEKCVVYPTRYRHDLNRTFRTKCFGAQRVSDYVSYMGDKMDQRRIQPDYIHRPSNMDRDKEHECLWHDSSLQLKVTEFLLATYEYYEFCHECMGSKNELF